MAVMIIAAALVSLELPQGAKHPSNGKKQCDNELYPQRKFLFLDSSHQQSRFDPVLAMLIVSPTEVNQPWRTVCGYGHCFVKSIERLVEL